MKRRTDIQNDSVWVFPMRYPLKIIGESQYPLQDAVVNILCPLFTDFNPATLHCRPSSGGRYLAISAEFTLHSKEQVNELYAQLAACPYIKWVI